MGTFDGAVALASDILRVALVLLGQAEKSVNGLLVCRRCQLYSQIRLLGGMNLQSWWP